MAQIYLFGLGLGGVDGWLYSDYNASLSSNWTQLELELELSLAKWFNIDKIVHNLLKLATSRSCSTSRNFFFFKLVVQVYFLIGWIDL